jgi:TRAP-type C4-dicarboxylate transport system permease small subunit
VKKAICKVLDILCWIVAHFSVIGGVGLIAMIAVTLTNVIMRLFRASVVGNMEMVCYLMIIIVFLCFGNATLNNVFIKVEVFDFKKAERPVRIAIDAIQFVICIYAAYCCFMQAGSAGRLGTVSQLLKIPRAPFLTLSAIGFILIAIAIPLKYYYDKVYVPALALPKIQRK